MTRFYYEHAGKRSGPFSGAQLKQLAAEGRILPDDTVVTESLDKRCNARSVKGLFEPTDAKPAARPPVSDVPRGTVTPTRAALVPPSVERDNDTPTLGPTAARDAKGTRWPWYVGAVAGVLSVVTGLVVIFAMLGNDENPTNNNLAVDAPAAAETTSKSALPIKSVAKRDDKTDVKSETKPEEKVGPRPRPRTDWISGMWRVDSYRNVISVPTGSGSVWYFGSRQPLRVRLELIGTYPGLPKLNVEDEFEFVEKDGGGVSCFSVVLPKKIPSDVVGNPNKSVVVDVYLCASTPATPYTPSVITHGYDPKNVAVVHKPSGAKVALLPTTGNDADLKSWHGISGFNVGDKVVWKANFLGASRSSKDQEFVKQFSVTRGLYKHPPKAVLVAVRPRKGETLKPTYSGAVTISGTLAGFEPLLVMIPDSVHGGFKTEQKNLPLIADAVVEEEAK